MLDPEDKPITNDDRTVLAETGSGGKASMHSVAAPSTQAAAMRLSSGTALLQGEQKEKANEEAKSPACWLGSFPS